MWFPGDLPRYATRYPVPDGAEARMTAAVIAGAPATVRAVYADDYDDLLAGVHDLLTDALDVSGRGFYETDWGAAPAGETHIAIVVDFEEGVDISDLTIGLAEVQIRS